MPKDNRGTLAAFDDLLSSLEGMVDDIKDLEDEEPAPSETDNEFYDFYFEINNVPRKASNAKSIPPSSNFSNHPKPATQAHHPVATSYDTTNNTDYSNGTLTSPQNDDIDFLLNDLLAPSVHHESPPPPTPSKPKAPAAPPAPTKPHQTPPAPHSNPNPAPHSNPNPAPASPYTRLSLVPPSPPNVKSNGGTLKPKPAPPKLQSKTPGKPSPNPNKSNLSLKKPNAKPPPKGSQLLLERSQNVSNVPYEPPQRFLSRGSYNTGASHVDAAPPPQTKEIPQRFLSTGNYVPNPPPQHHNPPPVPPSAASPSRNPFPLPPPRNTNTFAKEPPQRFYSTNNYQSSASNPPYNNREPPQRFFSTNNFSKGTSYHNPDIQRNSYIGNRQSPTTSNVPPQLFNSSSPPSASSPPSTQVPQQPKAPQMQNQNSHAPSQSYNSTPQAYKPPNQSYNSNPPSYQQPNQSYNNPLPYDPPPQSYEPPAPSYNNSSQSYNPPQSYTPPSQSYYPDPVPVREDSSRNRRSGNINSRKSDGEHTMAMNKYWCPSHFTCHECNRELSGTFSEENNQPYCSDCLGNRYACVTCGKGVLSGQFYLTEHGRRHAECMPVSICDMCRNPIRAGSTKMKALDKTFHPECFRCVTCNRVIEGEFTNRSGDPLCISCSHSSQPKCAKCYQSLTGQYVSYSSKKYHNECFACENCNNKLSLSGFYINNESIYCERCINIVMR